MAEELTMTAGHLPLVIRQEGMIKADAWFGTIGVRLDSATDGVQELFVFLRYGEPGRRPGGPFAGFGQASKPAADVASLIHVFV